MEVLKYRSVFDIIGPVMVGPSSSHTAGAARIGKVCRMILVNAQIQLNSTYMNHLLKHIADMEQISL